MEYLKSISTVVAALDNDTALNEVARAISELLPQARRVRPQAIDWNEELMQRLRLEEKKRFKQQRSLEL